MLRKALFAVVPAIAVAAALAISSASSNSAVDLDHVVAARSNDANVQPVYWDSRYGSQSWRDYGGRGEYRYFGWCNYGGYLSYRG